MPCYERQKCTTSDADNKKKSEQFADYFSSVVSKLKNVSFPLRDCIWEPNKPIPRRTTKKFKFQYISKVSVRTFLRKLKTDKATRLDELPAKMLKDCADLITNLLRFIINLSLSMSTVPEAWKKAKLVPIHKSGDTIKAQNYRLILVLSVLSKLLETSIQTQLSDYLENNRLLNDVQFGYRAKRSTVLATTR